MHRDVKPSNALMTSGDFTYLIDFGIAHDAAATKVTKTGAIIGTLAYMAPERFTTGVADARADVYSLTCMLHECLTGTQPYPGDSAEQQITDITLHPPKPSSLNPAIPAAFDDVIARGMAKQPTERFSSAGELARAASAAAASSQSQGARSGPRQPAPVSSRPDGRTQPEPETPPTPNTFASPNQRSASSGVGSWCWLPQQWRRFWPLPSSQRC